MSLIKNGDYVKITTLDSVPGNTNYKIKEYINLNGNKIYPFKFSDNDDYLSTLNLKLKDTVVIQGNYYDYEGSLFGGNNDESLSNNMCIINNNNKLIWYLGSGSNKYCEINAEEGTHIYGFSDGRPFYDNLILECIDENYTFDKELFFRKDKSSNSSYFAIGGNKISRIIIEVSDDSKVYSYYPCSDNTNIKIYEALQEEDFCWIDTTYTSSVGESIKYGVSIDDVKSAIGSKYRDLMAMMAEDSGNTYSINGVQPDNPYKIIQNGVEHDFAFALKDISIPEDANALSGQASSYKKGELIYGRRPKWNIWSNSMPYSIWNRPETDYNGLYDSSKPVYAMYNLTEHWGKDGKVKLEWFKDYCEGEADRPEVKFINEDGTDATDIEIHYHNGVVCVCDNDVMFPGLCNPNSDHAANYMFQYTFTNRSIFNYSNILPNSSVWMKLGNIINWNASQIEQYEADYVSQNEPTLNQLIYGECATLTHSFLTLLDIGGSIGDTVKVDILIGYATELTRQLLSSISSINRLNISNTPFVALSSDSNPMTKSKFKDGLVDNEQGDLIKKRFEKLRATGNEPVRLYNEILSSVNSSKLHIYRIDAVGSMNLLRKREEIGETETPKESDMVHLSKFILPTSLTIKGIFDVNELNGNSLFNLLKNAYWTSFPSSKVFSDSSLLNYGGSISMSTINPSGTNTTIIFMNETKLVTEDNFSLSHLDRLYINPSYNTYIPLYFFPIGFPAPNNSEYQRIQYEFINGRGLAIPFVLTTADFTTYLKMISNYNPLSEEGYNYYIHEKTSPSNDNERLYLISEYASGNYGSSYDGATYGTDNVYYVPAKSKYYPYNYLTRVKNGYLYINNEWKQYDNQNYPVSNYKFKYPTNLSLRFISEVVSNINLGTESDPIFLLKKDRVSKLVYRAEDSDLIYSTEYNGSTYYNTKITVNGTYSKTNLLLLSTDNDSKWFIWIKPEELLNICGSNRNENNVPTTIASSIPENITVKFWVFNEAYAPVMLLYQDSFAYMDINDSWYKNVIQNCVYIFIKDLLNNEWMLPRLTISNYNYNGVDKYCYTFKQIISHWFKGKKVNLFKCSNSDLDDNDKPIGGTYLSPTLENDSSFSGWTDTITLSQATKIWMTERFYAVPDNAESNDHAAENITDSEWSTPTEIVNYKGTVFNLQDYPHSDHASFILYVYKTEVDLFEENPNDYIKYVENDGFYGVYESVDDGEGNITTYYNSLVEKFELEPSGSYTRIYQACNELNEIKTAASRLSLGEWEIKIIYLNDNMTVDSYENVSYSGRETFYNTLYTNYKIKGTKSYHIGYSQGTEITEDVNDYILEQKYMFSINSTQTPLSEPDKWITLDELKLTTDTSVYNFMYKEEIIFNLFGDYRKIFEIIQIGGEQNVDKFYPIRVLDIEKLDNIAKTHQVYFDDLSHYYNEKYWYAIGGYSNDLKYYINDMWLSVGRNEILAPYKINNLNVSIYDILLCELKMNIILDNSSGRICEVYTSR